MKDNKHKSDISIKMAIQMQVTKHDMRFITEALSEAENSDMLMKH